MAWTNVWLSLAGLALAGLILFPQFRTLRNAQMVWLAFAELLTLLPWLPVSKLTFGDASIDIYRQSALSVD
jgi:hypothetical protein